MVTISMDGKQIEVPEGTTVLQAARTAGIHIPTLCDHPNLTPYGGCRMCLVEVQGARTLQPSCTLPVSNNMVVLTDTEKIREARKFVLTLIFSERNHFCMYCQKSNGECELQNCAYDEGMTHWPLPPNWTAYPVDASHLDYVMDHNRCILCRRCVRACGELVGNFTLGFEERGFNSFLVADFGLPLGESSCVSCGTCVQVCPTGALIDRRSAYLGHDVEIKQTNSICLGCSVGCSIEISSRDNRLVRINGSWDAEVNGGILCREGRFVPLNEERERILTPLVRKDGSLKAATWDEALQITSSRLTSLKGMNGNGIAALASTRLSAEALVAFEQYFVRQLGSRMVTTNEEGIYTSAASLVARENSSPFEGTLGNLEKSDCVLSVGLDLSKDHQVMGFFIKRNLPNGTKLILVDHQTSALAGLSQCVLKPVKKGEVDVLMSMGAALVEMGLAKTETILIDLKRYSPETIGPAVGLSAEDIRNAAQMLVSANSPAIVYSTHEVGPESQQLIKAVLLLAEFAGVKSPVHSSVISPKGQANSLTAAQLGLDISFQPAGRQAVFLALGDDHPTQGLLQKIEGTPFLAVMASYTSAATAHADVVFPISMWAETNGHYLNLEGRLQTANAALERPENVWEAQTVLENLAAISNQILDQDWRARLLETVSPVAIQLS